MVEKDYTEFAQMIDKVLGERPMVAKTFNAVFQGDAVGKQWIAVSFEERIKESTPDPVESAESTEQPASEPEMEETIALIGEDDVLEAVRKFLSDGVLADLTKQASEMTVTDEMIEELTDTIASQLGQEINGVLADIATAADGELQAAHKED